MFLDDVTFSNVIAHTPLVSIDLIVTDEQGRVLLGLRNNKPAKGFWFVPGGRILKNETIESAFKRLSQNEVGVEISVETAELLGVYTHLYSDSIFGESIGTHYVALAYRLILQSEKLRLPKGDQHTSYQWLEVAELLGNERVHKYTKLYFANS